jgi:hypothetical protein
MEIEIFAKLFELAGHGVQVLVLKGYDPEENSFTIEQKTEIDGDQYCLTLGFTSLTKRGEAFRLYDVEKAKQFVTHLRDQFS